MTDALRDAADMLGERAGMNAGERDADAQQPILEIDGR